MKNLRNKFSPPTADLVQKYIDSAYDKVVAVYNNLTQIISVADAIDDGTIEDWITEAEAQALIDAAVEGLYEHKGGYDAGTNTPDLDVDPSPLGIEKADTYVVTVAGLFFAETVGVGDLLIANVDNPLSLADWTIVEANLDPNDFATAAQGALADTALQPGDVGTAAYNATSDFANSVQGTLADSALQPGDNISELVNDSGFTDDQTPAEIETAYNAQVAAASQPEVEAGTEAGIRRFSPLRIAQAILAHITRYVGQNLQTGTAYQLVLTDAGKIVEMNNAAANTLTVPTNATVAFPLNTRIDIVQGGAGLTSIAAAGGVTINTATTLDSQGQYHGMSLWKKATDTWVLFGAASA